MIKFRKARSVKKRSTFKRSATGKEGALTSMHRKIAKGNRQSQQKGYVQT
jgi:hypothetical protein